MKLINGVSVKRMAIRNAMEYLASKNKKYTLYYTDFIVKGLVLKYESTKWVLTKECFAEVNAFTKDNLFEKIPC